MLALSKLQEVTEREINSGTVVPNDFSIVIEQNPHSESLEDLPAVYFAWVENILKNEPVELNDYNTDEIDENQNNVWSVNLGLTNLGYLGYMKSMGSLLVTKKKLEKKQRQLEAANGDGKEPTKKILQVKAEIKKLQTKSKNILKQGNEYKQNNPASARYAFVQFQSMNGKNKFLKAMDINACQRFWLRCKKKDESIADKYLGG